MRKTIIAVALVVAAAAAHAGLILSESVPPVWYIDLVIGAEQFGLILSE